MARVSSQSGRPDPAGAAAGHEPLRGVAVIANCRGARVREHESNRTFLLFQQQLGWQTVYAPGWRQNFSARDFAELYNLGSPVAPVYFNCQRESPEPAGEEGESGSGWK